MPGKFKKTNIFNENDRKQGKLKVAKKAAQNFKSAATKKKETQSHFMHASHSKGGGGAKKIGLAMGGGNSATVVVKTNYQVAGKLYNNKRATRKQIGGHAAASINYINNHGADDLQKSPDLSNVYNEDGELIKKEELRELLQSLTNDENIEAFRRTVVSVDAGLNRDDLKEVIARTVQEFKAEKDKNFNVHFAVHTNTENIHAHVIFTGTAKDININKQQLHDFKVKVAEKTEEVLNERKLEMQKEAELDKTLEKQSDKNLTLSQLIDKEMDGKLDDKFREKEIEEIVKKVVENDKQIDDSQNLSL